MIITTTEQIPGKKIQKILGIVKGNTVRTRHIGKDITALFKNIVGGEIEEYSELLSSAREQAIDRMIKNAYNLGANAIVGVRFSSSFVMQNAAEIIVYGTAVIIEN